MKKKFLLYALLIPSLIITEEKKPAKQKVTPKHSNIFVQKITNASNKAAFVALERVHAVPLGDTMDLSAPLMSGENFDLHDPAGQPYSLAVPVWQKTFRGNQFNIITLSGNPGRIYFLYTIDGHLWAIKTPETKGELKGVHLLDAADQDRHVEVKILDDNVLEIIVLDDKKKDPAQIKTAIPIAQQNKAVQNKAAPQASALQQRPTAPQSIENNRRALRHQLPVSTRARLRDTTPD